MKYKAFEWTGWYGVLAIVGGYALLNLGVLSYQDLAYQIMNATGSLAIIIETYQKKDIQPLVINVLWLIIALIAIVNLFLV